MSKSRKKTSLIKRLALASFVILISNLQSLCQNCSVNAGISTTICGNSSLVLNGNKNGLFATGNLSTWVQVSGPSVSILNPNSNTPAPSSHISTVTGFVSSNTYTFRITGYCQDGTSSTQTVNFTVVSVTSANAGLDRTVCPGTFAFAANALGSGETGAWSGAGGGFSIATPSSPTSNYTAPTTSSGPRTLTWTINNANGCSSSDNVVITNRGGVPTVNAGSDQVLSNCFLTTTTATMNASFAGNLGGQSGTWSLINGPNIPNIVNPNANNTSISNMVTGVYTFRWSAQGPCANGFDDVNVTVPGATQSITNVGSTSTALYCDGRTSVLLSRASPSFANEVVTWSNQSGPAGTIIANPNSPTVSISGLNGSSNYAFRYTLVNTATGCNTSVTSNINYNNSAPVITTGYSSTLLGCNLTGGLIPFTVSTSNTTNRYQIISGPLTTTSANTGNSPLSISGLNTPGTYTVRFTSVSNGIGTCPAGTADVLVTTSRLPTNANAGSQPAVACNVFTTGLSGNNPAVGTGTWSQISGPNIATILNPNSATANTITGMVNGTYNFRWLISGGPTCASSQSDVVVKVANSVPGVSSAGSDQSVCNSTPVFLTANTPASGETGTWSVVPTITSSNFYPDLNSPNISVSGLGAGTAYSFTWTISNACATNSSSSIVTVSTVAGPAQAFAGPDICRIGAFTTATLTGNNPSPAGATGMWTQVSGPTSSNILSPTTGTTALTGLTNGTYLFEWELSRGGCAPSKDTVMVTIALSSVAGANAGIDNGICGTSTQLLGNNISTVTGTWTQVSGGGGVSFLNPNLFNTSVVGLNSGSYTFRWTLANGVCPSTFDDVQINVSSPSTTASVGSDNDICGLTSTTLSGNAISNGTGIWSLVGAAPNVPTFSNVTSPNATVSGLISGSYTFRWSSSGGSFCATSTDDMIVNVAANANAGSNQNLCNTSSASLNGNNGTTGVWTPVTGPTSTILSVSGTSALVTDMSPGVYTFRYTADPKFTCPSTNSTVIVTTSGLGTTPDAGSDQNLCDQTSALLAGNVPIVGTGAWSIVSGSGASIVNSTLPNATLTGILPGTVGTTLTGTYLLQWTISNGSCSTFSDVVRIVSNKTPSISNAGTDQTNACSTFTFLAGNSPSVGVGQWSQVSGLPSTVTSPVLFNSQITNLTLGAYSFKWTISNGTCTPSEDQVDITVTGINPSIAVAGADQELCNASVTTLAGNTPALGTGSWSMFSGPTQALFVNSLSGITSVTGLVPGTYLLAWKTEFVSCSYTSIMQIINNPSPTVATVTGAAIETCPYSIPTLTGNNVTSGTGLWTKFSGPGSPVIKFPTAPVTPVNGLVAGNYIFRWTISSGNCTPSSSDLVVSVTGNCPPDAINLTFSGFEDQIAYGTVTGFSDPEGLIPTVSGGVFSSTNGRPLTIVGINPLNGVSRVSYSPLLNFIGTDTYQYQVCDQSLCTTATLTFSIVGVNDRPVALNLTVTGNKNTFMTSSLTGIVGSTIPGTVYDVDNAVVTINGILPFASINRTLTAGTNKNGAITILGNGAISYLPFVTFTGLDFYNINVCDPVTCTSAVIYFNVLSVNSPPIAPNFTFTGFEDQVLTGSLTGISDLDNHALTIDGVVLIGSNQRAFYTTSIGGLVTITGQGQIFYRPTVNFFGLDNISYQVFDPFTSTSGMIIFSIVGVNDPPTAINLTFTGIEDQLLMQTITGYADIDSPVLTVELVASPANGTLTLSGTGELNYLPNLDFIGIDSFTYQINDGLTVSGIRTVTLSISGVNDPPVAINLTFTGLEDQLLVNTITGYSDVDSPILTVQFVTAPISGLLTLSGNGMFRYLPNLNFNGLDIFEYQVSDGSTVSGIQTVTLSIVGVNDPPTAINLTFTGMEDQFIVETITGYADIDSPILMVELVAGPANGTLTLSGTGEMNYLPNLNFLGTDLFTYQINDGSTVSGIYSVTLSISGVNDPPVAVNLTFTGLEDQTIVNTITGYSDVDSPILTVQLVSTPISGLLTLSGNGLFSYLPNLNFNGLDSFEYQVSDGSTVSDIQTVTLSIVGVNDPPVALNIVTGSISGGSGNLQSINPLLGTDVDGTVFGYTIESLPPASAGKLFLGNNEITLGVFIPTSIAGTLGIVPVTTFVGQAYFTYNAIDNDLANSTATGLYTIPIVSNKLPVALDLTFSGVEDVILVNTITGFFDPDGTVPTLVSGVFTTSGNGTITISGNGLVSYLPILNFNGLDQITYSVCDFISCTSALITFSVAGVNDPPIALDLFFTTPEATALINSITGFSDPDGTIPVVTAGAFTTQQGNMITITGSGALVYLPRNNFNGLDQYTYSVCDLFTCTSAMLSFSVLGIENPPIAQDLYFNTLEDVPFTNSITGFSDPDGTIPTVTAGIYSLTGGNMLSVSGLGIIDFGPALNFNGTVSSVYFVCDLITCTSATLYISVTGVNDPPVAVDLNFSGPKNKAIVSSLSGYSDPDGNIFNLSILGVSLHGSITFTGFGFVYLPNNNFVGSDQINYLLTDEFAAQSTIKTITFNIFNDSLNLPPVFSTLTFTGASEDQLYSNTIQASDPEGTTITFQPGIFTTGEGGALTLTGNGGFNYIPKANFNGLDCFNVTACDSFNICSQKSICIAVNAVNDPPIANPDSIIANKLLMDTIKVVSNDTDIDGQIIEISFDSLGIDKNQIYYAGKGIFTVNGLEVTFFPLDNFAGVLNVTYFVKDNDGGRSNTAMITVTVPSKVSERSTFIPKGFSPMAMNTTKISSLKVTEKRFHLPFSTGGAMWSMKMPTTMVNGKARQTKV